MILFAAFASAFTPKDPEFPRQYHLKNDGKWFNGLSGEDINVVPAWKRNVTGKGVKVVVVMDGCHPDIAELGGRVDLDISYNFETKSNDPTPINTSLHIDTGNQLAGLLGAESNDLCGVGVAPGVTIGCINAYEGMSMKYYFEGINKYLNVDMTVIAATGSCSVVSNELVLCSALGYDAATEQALEKQMKTTLVTPITGVAAVNDDTSLKFLSSSPFVFTFAELSQRGGMTMPYAKGHTILASVVVGGGDYPSTVAATVAQLTSCSYAPGNCAMTVLPMQKGASIAAGVIALMMEASGKSLSRSDIVSIIARTSVRNDPYSPSWKKNAVGIWYSPLFGFGRLDADAATQMASNWVSRAPLEAEETVTNSTKAELPTFLGKALEYELDFSDSKVREVDFINVIVKMADEKIHDWGPVRVFVTSPSGTSRMIKNVQPLSEQVSQTLWRIAARDFHGEQATGKWLVTLRRELTGPEHYTVEYVNISIHGFKGSAFGKRTLSEPKTGSDPYQPYPIDPNVALEIAQTKVHCGETLTVKVSDSSKQEGVWDILISEDKEGSRIERLGTLYADMEAPLPIPCVRKTGTYRVRAQNAGTGVSSHCDHSVEIAGNDEYRFMAPAPYQVFRRKNGMVTIPVDVVRNETKLSEYSLTQMLDAVIYDIENDLRLYVGTIPLNSSIHYTYPYNCTKCILTVVPFDVDEPGMCDTLIQPISMIGEDQPDPEVFKVKWNNVCPVPPGVKTDDDDKASSKTLAIVLAVVIPVVVIAIVVVVVVFIRKGKTEKLDKVGFTESTLLES